MDAPSAPDAHLPWPRPVTVRPLHTALLLVDLQRQFLSASSPLAVFGADALVERSNAAARTIRTAGGLVVWVLQRLREETGPGVTSRRFGVGPIHSGDGADLDGRLEVGTGDVVLTKPRQSAFYGTDLEVILRMRSIGSVLIGGVTTNVCVLASAKDASERDLATHVLADLTLALPIGADASSRMTGDEVRRSALAFAQYAYGDVTTMELIHLESPGDRA
jgi:nicotinamidase-related amidase